MLPEPGNLEVRCGSDEVTRCHRQSSSWYGMLGSYGGRTQGCLNLALNQTLQIYYTYHKFSTYIKIQNVSYLLPVAPKVFLCKFTARPSISSLC